MKIEKKDVVKILIFLNRYFNFCVKKRVYEGQVGIDGWMDEGMGGGWIDNVIVQLEYSNLKKGIEKDGISEFFLIRFF